MVIREKLSLYSDYKPSMLECLACKKFTHPLEKCPLLHFIPDTRFLVNKTLFSCSQQRGFFPRKKKKKLNALFHNSMIQSKILLLDSSIFSDFEDIDEKESVCTIEKSLKPVEMISQENIEKIKEESDEESNCEENIPRFPENNNMINMNLSNLDEEITNKPSNEPKFVRFINKRTVSSDVLESCTKEGDNNSFSKKSVAISLEKIPSLKKITSRRNGVFENNDEGKENKEIGKLAELFFFDFESGKSYETYFPEGNVKNILEKINDKIISSPNSRASRKSSKQKMKKRIKCSKFFFQSSNHAASKELSNSS